MPKNTSVNITEKSSGAVHHNAPEPTKYITEKSQIHGSLRPELSAIAPNNGANTAIKIPVAASPQPQAACACARAASSAMPSAIRFPASVAVK